MSVAKRKWTNQGEVLKDLHLEEVHGVVVGLEEGVGGRRGVEGPQLGVVENIAVVVHQERIAQRPQKVPRRQLRQLLYQLSTVSLSQTVGGQRTDLHGDSDADDALEGSVDDDREGDCGRQLHVPPDPPSGEAEQCFC